ncbi:hypothetical protein ACTA71_009557 [Dictyostelium dimigraforme]
MPGVLPQKLEHLYLSPSFNGNIGVNVLPSTLKTLSFDMFSRFNHFIEENVVPFGSETLILGIYYNQPLGNIQVDNLKLLQISGESLEIPQNVQSLKILLYCTNRYGNEINEFQIPNQVKILKLDSFNNQLKPTLLLNCYQLTTLFLDYKFKLLPNIFPINLKSLSIANNLDFPSESDVLPSSFNHLSLLQSDIQFKVLTFQTQLKHWNLGFETKIQFPFPPTLKQIYLCITNTSILKDSSLFYQLSPITKVLSSYKLSKIFKRIIKINK